MASKEKGPNRNAINKLLKKKKREKKDGDEMRTCEEKDDVAEVGGGGNLSGSKKKIKKKHNREGKEQTLEENLDKDSTQKTKKKSDEKKKHNKEGKEPTIEENVLEKDGTQKTKKKKKQKDDKDNSVEENILDKDGTQKTKKKIDDTKRLRRKKSSKRGGDRNREEKKDDKKEDKNDKDDDKKKDKEKEKTVDEPNTVFEAVKAPVHPAHSNTKHMNHHFLKDLKKLKEADKNEHDDKDKSKEKKKKDSGEKKDDEKKEKPKTPPQVVDDGFLPTVFEHVNAPVLPADAEKKIKRPRHHKDKDKDKDKDSKDPKAIISNAPESEAVQSIQGEVSKPVYQTLPKKDVVAPAIPDAAISMYAPDGLAITIPTVNKDVPSTKSAREASQAANENKAMEDANAEANTRTAFVPIKNITEVHYRLVIYNGVKRYEPILPKPDKDKDKEKDKESQETSEEKSGKKSSQKRSSSPPQFAESCMASAPVAAKLSAEKANKPFIEILPLPGASPLGETDANKKDANDKDGKDSPPALAPMSMYVAPINEDKNKNQGRA